MPAKANAGGAAAMMMALANAMQAAAGSGGARPAAVSGGAGGGSGGAVALQCPMEACAALPEAPPEAASMGFKIALCCADNGQCGTSLNDAACVFTPDSLAECPLINLMGFSIPNCCTPEGRCGIDGSAFMRGCGSLEDAQAMAGLFVTFPPGKACTPKPP